MSVVFVILGALLWHTPPRIKLEELAHAFRKVVVTQASTMRCCSERGNGSHLYRFIWLYNPNPFTVNRYF
ncbi:MAG: hypothetical protein MJZ42_03555 [Bacteroidales bacterium]|nr:hypothetical protein [Bacteroidales bacterium]